MGLVVITPGSSIVPKIKLEATHHELRQELSRADLIAPKLADLPADFEHLLHTGMSSLARRAHQEAGRLNISPELALDALEFRFPRAKSIEDYLNAQVKLRADEQLAQRTAKETGLTLPKLLSRMGENLAPSS